MEGADWTQIDLLDTLCGARLASDARASGGGGCTPENGRNSRSNTLGRRNRKLNTTEQRSNDLAPLGECTFAEAGNACRSCHQ
eukprot:764496-Hanusia_phi.AAC.1